MNKLVRVVLLFGFFLGLLSPSFAYTVSSSAADWQPGPSLTSSRSDATATLLNDGRVAFVGGKDADGNPLATMELLMPDGTMAAGPSMSVARSEHGAVLLADGRLLVAGGRSTYGAVLNSAEIFDPKTNAWTSVQNLMKDPRADFTMSALPSGDVLIAGGDTGAGPVVSIDRFNLATGAFTYETSLSVGRMKHAATVLKDGRVLFTGGLGVGSGGSLSALTWSEIYDPSANTMTSAAPLNTARSAHSSTTLIDGTVLIAGGNNSSGDLASLEIFDPAANTMTMSSASLATARSGHVALLLPNNNQVLIAGGTSGGSALSSSELYRSWTASMVGISPMSLARLGAAASALQKDGSAVVGGGSSSLATDLLSFATVKTDATDYPPGTPVNISGSGWVPGETVTLGLLEAPLYDQPPQMTSIADAQGNISNSQFAPDIYDLNTRFYLTARGSASEAQTTFTDGQTVSVTLSISGPSATVSNSLNANKCVWNSTTQTGAGCTVSLDNGTQVIFTASSGANWSTTTQQYTLNCSAGSSTCTVTTAGNKDAILSVVILNKVTPVLSLTNSPVTYNGTPQAATIQGSVAGTVSNVRYGGSATVPSQAGTYVVTADFSPTDTATYNSVTGAAAGNFVIQKATPTLSITNSPAIYSGNAQPATLAAAGVGGAALTGSFTNLKYNGSATTPTNTGQYAVTANYVPQDVANYNSLTAASAGTFTINKAAASVTPAAASKTYGTADPALTGTLTGFLAADNVVATYSRTAGETVAGGPYTISATLAPAGVLGNYDITYNTASFTINKATVTITAKTIKKTLGQALTFQGTEFTTAGIVMGDTVTSVTLTSTGAAATANVGSYPIVPSAAQGAGLDNYNVSYVNGTLSVIYSVNACLGDLGHSILQPINPNGTSTFKQGSTVPAKFRVCDVNGNSIGSGGVVSGFNLVGVLNGTITATVDEAVASTTPDANFRWDPSGQQWIFNISTKPLAVGRTYIYAVALNDGSTITFQYGLPK